MDSRESEDDSTPKLHYRIIRGLSFPTLMEKEVIESICDYMPQDGDVIINSYPKTGSLWMSYILQQIITRGSFFPTFTDMRTKVIPSLELTGLSAINMMTTKPRIYRHNLPYDMVQKNQNTKIIYLFRKPEDTFISRYHYKRNWDLSLNFDQCFEDFLSGNISFGRYFEHIKSYLNHINDGNILMISYEKLQIQKKEEILRIAKFLGDDHYEVLSNDETVMKTILEHVNFDYMKQHLIYKIPEMPKDYTTYFRSGNIGEGKKALTDQQLSRLREVTIATMKGTEILEEWLQN